MTVVGRVQADWSWRAPGAHCTILLHMIVKFWGSRVPLSSGVCLCVCSLQAQASACMCFRGTQQCYGAAEASAVMMCCPQCTLRALLQPAAGAMSWCGQGRQLRSRRAHLPGAVLRGGRCVAERCGRDQECLCTAISVCLPLLASSLASSRAVVAPLSPGAHVGVPRQTRHLPFGVDAIMPRPNRHALDAVLFCCVWACRRHSSAAWCPPRMHVPAATQAALGKVNHG